MTASSIPPLPVFPCHLPSIDVLYFSQPLVCIISQMCHFYFLLQGFCNMFPPLLGNYFYYLTFNMQLAHILWETSADSPKQCHSLFLCQHHNQYVPVFLHFSHVIVISFYKSVFPGRIRVPCSLVTFQLSRIRFLIYVFLALHICLIFEFLPRLRNFKLSSTEWK